jgi:hypothetical protein
LQAATRLAVKRDFLCGVFMKAIEIGGSKDLRGVQAGACEAIVMRYTIWAIFEEITSILQMIALMGIQTHMLALSVLEEELSAHKAGWPWIFVRATPLARSSALNLSDCESGNFSAGGTGGFGMKR